MNVTKGSQIKRYSAMVLFFLVLFLCTYMAFAMDALPWTEHIGNHVVAGFFIVMILMCIGTVIAPIAVTPLIPLSATLIGPFVTGLASWIGWTLGAVIAFWIARHGGKPILARFVSLESLALYEARVPKDTHFGIICALRIVLPVDILSYALGLFSAVSFRVYTLASAVGIFWFSFFLAYFVPLMKTGNPVLFIGYSVASASIFGGSLWYVYTTAKRGFSQSN